MIVLDTNVISELLRPIPSERVVDWFRAQPQATLFTTVITRSELLYGICLMPIGKRRDLLQREVLAIFNVDLAGRVLNYESDAADAYAQIASARRTGGKPQGKPFDAMIAGIARSRGATLATRNIRDFEDCGVALIDPWQ
ncbi:MAG: type II toxin-antitoxin system VapC family toxin [Pseudomarimonas sp.]